MLFAIVGRASRWACISGYRRNSAADVGTMVVANLGVSIPVFVLGLLLAFVFAHRPQGHAVRAAAVGPAELRASSVIPLVEVWGLEDLEGPPRGSSTSCPGIYTLSRAHHRPVGRLRSTRSAT